MGFGLRPKASSAAPAILAATAAPASLLAPAALAQNHQLNVRYDAEQARIMILIKSHEVNIQESMKVFLVLKS